MKFSVSSVFFLIGCLAYSYSQSPESSLGPGNALVNLLSGKQGWTENGPIQEIPIESYPLSDKPQLFAAQIELLRLLEMLVQVKGEVFSRVNDIVLNNYELITAILNLLINKIKALHNFSLAGLSVVRRILEYAADAFAHLGNQPLQ
ncbi:uncharacterized protein LOC108733481 isoform X2 [Agrilus planipennis]|uniref:Uncharacterized protein LOC108733481 isoform X2 n=1 Tax=Agrilus planipennis TaxID=224129 RepID=A0A1W4W7V1_AGRPL|nr:uncharacterized protein LOC108733481 isoform X2 [Agrilus planipennis]